MNGNKRKEYQLHCIALAEHIRLPLILLNELRKPCGCMYNVCWEDVYKLDAYEHENHGKEDVRA